MKRVQRLFIKSILAGALGFAMFPASADACTYEPYLGSVCYMASNYCPESYLPADGRTMSVSQNQALYAVIGNLYGGSAPNTFALPDLRGRAAIGAGRLNGNTPLYNAGQQVGQEGAPFIASTSVTLTASQIPPHTHPATLTLNGSAGTTPVASGSVSLALSGSITNLPFSAVASLPVTGIAKIGSSTTTGRSANLTDKALLTTVVGPAAQIYAPSGTNDRQVGPDGGVTGTASGSVSGTASGGQLAGTASGNVSLPLTAAVSVGPNATLPAPVVIQVPVSLPVRDPSLTMTACIAVNGLYPPRP
ncbi:phage tail protein [Pectobacterium aquaticum]|uniref:phage tail protein n=1 Tax=Pectobacterium aquaticum TaxID=2204145 RepID=UPI000C7F2824|nr:tail fiber protein [Pectobacterium aquaticum]PLY38668.1 phage tail protein [Pectobacterium carotovorum]RRN90710.1 tail fiber protein [Pectobacterium aquaticum]UEM38283.1 tail fiber protein [Pectobacterium aquaticum]